jgi:hypothetical protein
MQDFMQLPTQMFGAATEVLDVSILNAMSHNENTANPKTTDSEVKATGTGSGDKGSRIYPTSSEKLTLWKRREMAQKAADNCNDAQDVEEDPDAQFGFHSHRSRCDPNNERDVPSS